MTTLGDLGAKAWVSMTPGRSDKGTYSPRGAHLKQPGPHILLSLGPSLSSFKARPVARPAVAPEGSSHHLFVPFNIII